MQTMFELINALNALTKAVEALTAKTTTEYLNGFETIYEPPSEEESPKEGTPVEQPTSEPQTVTFVQLRSRLSEISRCGHTAEVKKLIVKYGAEKLSDLAESDYAALLAEAEGLV